MVPFGAEHTYMALSMWIPPSTGSHSEICEASARQWKLSHSLIFQGGCWEGIDVQAHFVKICSSSVALWFRLLRPTCHSTAVLFGFKLRSYLRAHVLVDQRRPSPSALWLQNGGHGSKWREGSLHSNSRFLHACHRYTSSDCCMWSTAYNSVQRTNLSRFRRRSCRKLLRNTERPPASNLPTPWMI